MKIDGRRFELVIRNGMFRAKYGQSEFGCWATKPAPHQVADAWKRTKKKK